MVQTIQQHLEETTRQCVGLAATAATSRPGGSVSNRQVLYMDTIQAYDKWAKVYDTDGNFLQALDTIGTQMLLPEFLVRAQDTFAPHHLPDQQEKPSPLPWGQSLRLVDMGCGTGRSTLLLLAAAPRDAEIVGLDASPGMLDVARAAVDCALREDGSHQAEMVRLEAYNLLRSPPAPPACALNADGVISTLVLEHIPVEAFFAVVGALLKPGGHLLVTNMHSEMGAISQAGFVDVATGVKIRPTSYSHTIVDVLNAAARANFEVVRMGDREVWEQSVHEEMLNDLGDRARKWIGITVWFGVCFKKRGDF